MAQVIPWEKLQEEATCSICWKYYTHPYILDCGHSFCVCCILQCWKLFPEITACPQCRTPVESMNCRPNTPLSNVVGIVKLSSSQVKKVEEGKKICEKHLEPSRTVFCVEDQIIFCQECEESNQHRNHVLASVEETAQVYKDWYSSYIMVLKEERAEMVKHKLCLVQWTEHLEKKSVTERETVAACFKQLHEFLDDQEENLLKCLESLPREIAEKRNRCRDMAHLFLDIFSVENDIRLLQEKASQPTLEFLRDALQTFYRCQKRTKWMPLDDTSLDVKWRVWKLLEISAAMVGLADYYKVTLQTALSMRRANVTLDNKSNHPKLFLSSDGKSVKWQPTAERLPSSSKRFDQFFCVVGCQEFKLGHHFWDVIVKGRGEWAVGVAKSSMRRKGYINLFAEERVFALGKLKQQYWAMNMQNSRVLPLDGELRWIQVSLNCSAKRVTFYDVPRAMRIFGFTKVGSFEETYLPFFWLNGEIQLTIIL